MSTKTILTGDRPTGPLHLGHFVGSLLNRVELQHSYRQFIIIADTQAMTDNFENIPLVRSNIKQVLLDYLAVGIDPGISTIFVQSKIPELYELTMHYMNLVTVARLERNPTVKEEIRQKNFERDLPVGFFVYPISQAADITAFKADTVPVGEDQLPMIEQTNEIVRRFNRIYRTEILVEATAVVPEHARVPGIDGNAKMGKSLGNAIYLCDDEDQITKKVNLMFTDPGHLRAADPGKVEGNVVFQYLDIFDAEKADVAALKDHYQRGGLGDALVKRRLNDILQAKLAPIRRRRREFERDEQALESILAAGTAKARAVAVQTLDSVRHAMGI